MNDAVLGFLGMLLAYSIGLYMGWFEAKNKFSHNTIEHEQKQRKSDSTR